MSETKPVTLWRTAYNRFYNDGDTVGGNGFYEEYRALPAAEFDALLARVKAAEAERDALRKFVEKCARDGYAESAMGDVADDAVLLLALLGPAHDAPPASGGTRQS